MEPTRSPDTGDPREANRMPPGQGAGGPEYTGRDAAEAARRAARSTAETVKSGASEAMSQTADAARAAGERVRHTATDAARLARDYGSGVLEDQKRRAGDGLQTFVSALRGAAERLHNDRDDNLAAYADAAAEQIDRMSSYLRDRPANELMGDVRDAARRRPEWVVGGMFVAGLAIARFLKASSPDRGRQTYASSGSSGARSAANYGQGDTFRRDIASGSGLGGAAGSPAAPSGIGTSWAVPPTSTQTGSATGTGSGPGTPPPMTSGRTVMTAFSTDAVTASVNSDPNRTPASGGSAGGAPHDPTNLNQPDARGTPGGGAEVK